MKEPGETNTAVSVTESTPTEVTPPVNPVARTAAILVRGAMQGGLAKTSRGDRAEVASALVTLAAQAQKKDKPPDHED